MLANYSRVQKSIENWSVWSKMALEEVGVSLPWKGGGSSVPQKNLQINLKNRVNCLSLSFI